MALSGKKILLAVSGSIAAYKSALLCRMLVKEGCEVRIVMTHAAADFITPLTLSTLSGNPVYTDISDESSWNNHVELGLWADAMIVAPATAATIARMAQGIADNMLVACYLSARCPVYVAPAMDADMWAHGSTKRNLELLAAYGVKIWPVGYGALASGLTGDGRMAEPEEIIKYLKADFEISADLSGMKVLITAGPTYEPLDPVRFIGNRSSGKMGFALAEACRVRGAARVTVVSGPVSIPSPDKDINIVKVETAEEMLLQCMHWADDADVIIFAAAVADFRADHVPDTKIKKTSSDLSIRLVPTEDIAATMAARKKPGQIFVGFALETDDEKTNALKKLHKKKFDFIVLNSLNDTGAGFRYDTNKITILTTDGEEQNFELKSKIAVAHDIVDAVVRVKKSVS